MTVGETLGALAVGDIDGWETDGAPDGLLEGCDVEGELVGSQEGREDDGAFEGVLEGLEVEGV